MHLDLERSRLELAEVMPIVCLALAASGIAPAFALFVLGLGLGPCLGFSP